MTRFMRNFGAFVLGMTVVLVACSPTKVQAAEPDLHYTCTTGQYGTFPMILQDDLAGWIQLDQEHQPLTWSDISEGAGTLVSWSTVEGVALIIFNAKSGLGKLMFMGETEAEDVLICTQDAPV